MSSRNVTWSKTISPWIAPAVTRLVLIQLRLFLHQFEDAPGAGNAHLHQRKGEDGDKGGEAQHAHQPHVGDKLADRQFAARHQPGAVGKGDGQCKAQQQQRQVARLDLALLDEEIAHAAGRSS